MLIDLEKSVHYKINNSSWFRDKREIISKKDITLLKDIKSEINKLSEEKLNKLKSEMYPSVWVLKFRYQNFYIPFAVLSFFALYKYYRIGLYIWAFFVVHIAYLLRKWQMNAYTELGVFIHEMRLEIDTDYYEKSDEYLQKRNG